MSTTDVQADLLAALIASTATFQSVTNTASMASARVRIAIGEATDEGHDDSDGQTPLDLPRAVVTRASERTSVVGTATYAGSGELLVLFEFRAPGSKVTQNEQEAWFTAATSDIVREAFTLSVSRASPTGYSTSHLQIRSAEMSDVSYLRPGLDQQPDENETRPRLRWQREWRVEY